MPGLRAAAHDIARGAMPTVLVSDRLLALERLAGRLANRRRRPSRSGARSGRSVDRATIHAYLLGDPADEIRRAAARIAAERHDWSWRDRGARWQLWEGPAILAAGLRDVSDPAALLREAGLIGRLALGGFAVAALDRAGWPA